MQFKTCSGDFRKGEIQIRRKLVFWNDSSIKKSHYSDKLSQCSHFEPQISEFT